MSETSEQATNPQKLSEKYFYRRIGTMAAEKVEKRLMPDYMKQIWQRNARLWEMHDRKDPTFNDEVTRWINEIRNGEGKETPGLKALRGKPETKPHVSIVVPTHNEERYILQLLSSIAAQKYDKGVEVLIMDNNSSPNDRTSTFAEQCGAKVIKYSFSKDDPESRLSQTGLARQKGLEIAAGDIVISTDGDAIAPHEWITAMAEYLDRDPRIAAVTGGIVHYDRPEHYLIYGKDIVLKVFRKFLAIYRNRQGPSKKQKSPTSGANTAFRKVDALSVGGYDTIKYPGEDTSLGFQLSKTGKLVFIDNENTRVRVSPRRFGEIGRMGIVQGVLDYHKIYNTKDNAPIIKR